MQTSKVLIVLGSDSDLKDVEVTEETLSEFGVTSTTRIASAHRSPEHTAALLSGAADNGYAVVICGAGLAAHLAGTCAAYTLLPVIAIPFARSPLGGRDALYASVMMPGGVPVAAMAIGAPGAKNAALFALRILALSSPALMAKLISYRKKLSDGVLIKDKGLASIET